MKKFIRKMLTIAAALLIASFFLMCMTETKLISESVTEAVGRCINIVIPSLYAMMTASALMTKSGICKCVPSAADVISRRIFGISGSELSIFIFSMFAGYPVGNAMLLEEYHSGRITSRRASVLSGLCFGAGPAFIFGCISGRVYQSANVGIMITVSVAAGNTVLLLALSPLLRKDIPEQTAGERVKFNADMLTESVVQSGRSMANICFAITAFSAVSVVFEAVGAVSAAGRLLSSLTGIAESSAAKLVTAFLDITNISRLSVGELSLLPFISGLTAFGGICVMFQISSLVRGGFSIKPLLILRLLGGIVSGVVCRMIMPFFLRHELLAASTAKVKVYSPPSPVPSLMLVIMTFMLLAELPRKTRK